MTRPPPSFRAVVTSLLPSEERLRARLAALTSADRRSIVDGWSVRLPEVDVVVALPGGEDLARALSMLRGTLTVIAERDGEQWRLSPPLDEPGLSAVLVTPEFGSGKDELEVALVAARHGLRARVVAAAVERTSDVGRARLELQGVTILAAVQVADTPTGLVLERRYPVGS